MIKTTEHTHVNIHRVTRTPARTNDPLVLQLGSWLDRSYCLAQKIPWKPPKLPHLRPFRFRQRARLTLIFAKTNVRANTPFPLFCISTFILNLLGNGTLIMVVCAALSVARCSWFSFAFLVRKLLVLMAHALTSWFGECVFFFGTIA